MTDHDDPPPSWIDALAPAVEPLDGSDVLHCSVARMGPHEVVLVRWNFSRHGGTFGSLEADRFVSATAVAASRGLPLVTVLRSGGTRLQEGMQALVGIPRTALALAQLRAAGVPHLSVADDPSTGGVWVGIGTQADLRAAIRGATVGFSGPRVVSAMTNRDLAAGANTAEAAYGAGLVDEIADHDGVGTWLTTALTALSPDRPDAVAPGTEAPPPEADGAEQFTASRHVDRPGGGELIDRLLDHPVELRSADETTRATLGRLAGRRVVAVALARHRGGMPGPAGFGLVGRAARLAGCLDIPLVVLVDTPGADPHTEDAGLSGAIAEAMREVLATPAPTLSFLHGEGGSGGALAGATTDLLAVGRYGWFAALGPDGAAAALRTSPEQAARMMRITPLELLEDKVADVYVEPGAELVRLATAIDLLRRLPAEQRLTQRHTRWSSALPGMR
jgi:acetyl-CoA carboxylase carboxyl transferase subunit beta